MPVLGRCWKMSIPVVVCPNCGELILIEKIRCGVFIHGTKISTGKQIPSHSGKKTCESLIKKKDIYGCGKGFVVKKDWTTTKV